MSGDEVCARAPRITMIGTDFDTMGGISSVVGVYRDAGLFQRWDIGYVASHQDGPRWAKLLRFARAWCRFVFRLLARRPDLVHIHSSSGPSFWRKLTFFVPATAMRVPVIFHIHAGRFPRFYERLHPRIGQPLVRWVLRRSACVVALSPYWATILERIERHAKVRVVFNPVQIPNCLDHHPVDGKIVCLGRLSRSKGTPELVRAFAAISVRHPQATLHLAGDGDTRTVEQDCAALGIAGRVHLLGWVRGEAKESLLRSAAIYVLPSHFEGLPMGVLEAMARGIAVVASSVGGVPDAVRDGRDGLLVPIDNVERLAAALDRLLSDPSLAKQLGASAHERAAHAFSSERIVENLSALYRDVLGWDDKPGDADRGAAVGETVLSDCGPRE